MYLGMKGMLGAVRRRTAAMLATATLAGTFVVGAAPFAAAQQEDVVVFEGSGWGHGVGLSQYGAYGMAKVDGSTAEEILAQYYQGVSLTTLDAVGDPVGPLWVNLETDVTAITLIARKVGYATPPGPTAALTATRDGEARELAVDDRLAITWIEDTATCDVVHENPGGGVVADLGPGSCDIDLAWDGDADQPTRKVEIAGCTLADWNASPSTDRPCQYGRGSIVVRAPGPPGADPPPTGPVDVSLVIDLEDYVLGISEMPYYWGTATNAGAEALRAQAIAARSYARAKQLARPEPGNNACRAWCHIRDTAVDQRYVGWGHGWDEWIDAVEVTAGIVMTHPGTPESQQGIVAGFYSSSSGGATENNSDVWPGTQLPYLISVDDHWALLPEVANGNGSWSVTVTAGSVASALGLDSLTSARVIDRYPSQSAKTVEFTGTAASVTTVVTRSGDWVKSTFGLKSRYFDVSFGAPPPYIDIDATIHKPDIEYLAARGVTLPCDAGPDRYCPDDFMEREDMAAFMARALDLPAVSEDYFVDDNGLTHEGAINSIGARKITRGCNPPVNDRYCPASSVTRGQMAAFLVRAFALSAGLSTDRFVDDDSSIFENDIDRIAAAGVTLGCNPPANDRYCPDRFVTRAEMASFLARALRDLGG